MKEKMKEILTGIVNPNFANAKFAQGRGNPDRVSIVKFGIKLKRNDFFSSFLRRILFLLSLIYVFMIKIILFLYDAKVLKKFKADCAVISIGNITMGGTGKTPFLIFLTQRLLEKKKEVVVVSRGYAEDEIKEFKFFVPSADIFCGRKRAAIIKKVLKNKKADCILLDDGFQHWQVDRDVDIVMLDAGVSLEEERILPAGFLREPISHLKRAQIIVLTKAEFSREDKLASFKAKLKKLNSNFEIFEVLFKPVNFLNVKKRTTASLEDLKNKRAGLFCGIGNPGYFVKKAEEIGLKIDSKLFFSDHHNYDEKDLALIARDAAEKKLDTYITTFKDISKIDVNKFDFDVYCLKIEAEFKGKENEEKFFRLIDNCFSA